MSKHKKDPLLEALAEGRSYTWTVSGGGDLASMRNAIRHGQTLTMSPVTDPGEVQVGDIVLVRWHKGYMKHLVGEIQGDQFLIVNSVGKVNGWVGAGDILGRVTSIVDPEPRPTVPEMLDWLEAFYQHRMEGERPSEEEMQRLCSITADLRWYAGRIGAGRWNTLPRSNKWSFEQNLWWLVKRAREAAAPTPDRTLRVIDQGKMVVGWASEIYALLEYGEAY